MNARRNRPSLVHALAALAGATLVLLTACGGKDGAAAKAAPAKVDQPVKETELTTLTLTPQAVERLGITTAKAEVRAVARVLRLGGEIIARPGSEAVVAAPSAGVVLAPAKGSLPLSGAKVARGQEILRLVLLPAGTDLSGARNDLEVKKIQSDAAAAKARRAEELLRDKAASEKAVEEARSEFAAADAALQAARARWDALNGVPLDAAVLNLSAMTFTSPVSGVLEMMSVASGQTVASGTALFEVAAVDPVWVRVPVYVGDLATVDRTQPARVETLGAAAGAQALAAKPVQGPPLGDAAAASADLYYELANPDGLLRIGQKISATLPLRTTENSLVVPWASILFDAQGGTWVYVRTAATVFVRQRVELRHIVGREAVVGRGLAAGAEVVVDGAAELFGTEFGVGK